MIREYWPYLLLAIGIALILAFLLLRPKQRVTLSDSAPIRPHMTQAAPPEGRGIAGEAAAATSDVTGEFLRAPVHQHLKDDDSDDLLLLKGVGPKLADTLQSLGFSRFEQIAKLTPAEMERVDAQLGAFRGRLSRDRIVEQADYLARGDTDGFEQRFGKL
ncbi:hypothetical protein H9L13_00395 [Sphingomonas lutea]|uniref:Helix-hairpin-helix domain-containing protein n=2 Tax=Sphingomonas lutea TaxID=1045317 RepID=A0A7G9SKS7_9SPHN|nr:hypothetical protein H9L13_00395 [Sphingomonas lutea]